MNRITNRDLEGVVKRLNQITDSPLDAYTRDETGKFKANIGCYTLDYAYGGVQLQRICSEGGGITCPIGSGHVSKRELYSLIHAYMNGILSKE